MLWGLLASPGAADPATRSPQINDAIHLLDLWIEEQMAYHGSPGLSLGIVYDQELIWSAGYGSTHLGADTAITPGTPFRIGSVSKLFTATAILILRDQGKLRLDDPVARHLPQFRIQSPFQQSPEITLRHVLTHTAGLPREGAFPYWTTHKFPSQAEILKALTEQTAIHPPGEVYQYSNLGLGILGHVVAAVSGKTYAEFVRENIFEPLGMLSSAVFPDDRMIARLPAAWMRRMPDGRRRRHDYYSMEGLAAAGNIVSTVEDLARFAALQFRGGPAGGGQILRGSTLREMHRPHFVHASWDGGRALGWSVSLRKGKTFVLHGGWIGGHRTYLILVPNEKIAVLAMTNADDESPSRYGFQAYDLVGPALLAAATPEPAAEKPADPAWQDYGGTYSDPWGWEYKVFILNNHLVMYGLDYPPADDPRPGITQLEPVAEHTFRMDNGEFVVFEMDTDGQVKRVKRRADYLEPLKP
jgi:CubicO group peptidase (beta-lactamase class C family)